MRSKFTETGPIPVTEIMLDTKNYRIGEAEDQSECIELLFRAFGPKMLAIADHISRVGLSIKPIVVQKDNGNWVVKDGNRRIAAIQLLNNPALAPEEHKAAFMKMKAEHFKLGNIPAAVTCSTSDDPEAIYNYMQLEHLGEQDGAGLVRWGARERDNLTLDMGGKSSVGIAKKVLSYLETHGLNEAKTVKITNIQRLLQDTYVQSQLGIVWDGENFSFALNEEETRNALTEIVLDFSIREQKVAVIYERADRKRYIDNLLVDRGFRPSAVPAPSTAPSPAGPTTPTPAPAPPVAGAPAPKPIPVPAKPPHLRKRLIPKGQGLNVPSTAPKVNTIIYELANHIEVAKAPVSASVLLRLLIEFSVENYMEAHTLTVTRNYLHLKIEAVARHLEGNGRIDNKARETLCKMHDSNKLLSAHTLNQYVHKSDYTPTGQELNTYWDNIYKFLQLCW